MSPPTSTAEGAAGGGAGCTAGSGPGSSHADEGETRASTQGAAGRAAGGSPVETVVVEEHRGGAPLVEAGGVVWSGRRGAAALRGCASAGLRLPASQRGVARGGA